MIADIAVSHGYFCDEVALQLGASKPIWTEFCGMTSYRLSRKNSSLAADDRSNIEIALNLIASDEHVKSKAHGNSNY